MEMKPSDLREIVICRIGNDTKECSCVMRDTHSRHCVIVDAKDKPEGIISAVDIVYRVVAVGKDPQATKVEEVMTKDLATVDIKEGYAVAFARMRSKNTFAIPVTRQGKLLGQIDIHVCMKRLHEMEKKGVQ